MNTPLDDPRAEKVLGRLHAQNARQMGALLWHYLPRAIRSLFTGRSGIDASSPLDAAFLRDKMVALHPDKASLAYTFCRALDARCAVEVGTSFGVSTIYLAAALRDNGGGERRVIGTEIEPAKVAAARANIAEAGLGDFVDIREGDALKTLTDLPDAVDFLLIDTWIPVALPALKLVAPRLRPGAIVMCDNVRQFAKEYRDYTTFIRDPANGFRSMLWPNMGGVEISVRTPHREAEVP